MRALVDSISNILNMYCDDTVMLYGITSMA